MVLAVGHTSPAGVPLLVVGAMLMAFALVIGIGVLSRRSRLNRESPRLRRPFGLGAGVSAVLGLALVIAGVAVR